MRLRFFDEKLGRILSENSVLAVQVRSITDVFRQTIYFEFGKNLDPHNMFDLITRLLELGVLVRAITSDSGPKNRRLWADLGCTEDKFYFTHNDIKIHVFTDMSHNLKLVREHLIDNKIKLENGQIIDGGPIINLMNQRKCGLLAQHVTPLKTKDKQNVSYALKVFNREVTTELKKDHKILANFMDLIIDYFDIFNLTAKREDFLDSGSKDKYFKKLDEVADIVGNARVSTKKKMTFRPCMIPFQQSIVMSCDSLKNIYNDLVFEYGDDIAIPTHVFSSDLLESFFGMIRGFASGSDRNPTPTLFVSRLKLLLICKLDGVHASRNVSPTNAHYDENNIASILETILNRYKEEPDQEIDAEILDELQTIESEGRNQPLLRNFIFEPVDAGVEGVHDTIEYYMDSIPDEKFKMRRFLREIMLQLGEKLRTDGMVISERLLKSIICNLCHKRAHKMEHDRQKANDERNDKNTLTRREKSSQPKRARQVFSEPSDTPAPSRGRPKKVPHSAAIPNSSTTAIPNSRVTRSCTIRANSIALTQSKKSKK